jgi:uncharacterized membrane protein
MDLFGLGGRIFRVRLKRELPHWREQGIVDEATAESLTARYHLDEEGVSVAAAAIYTLGALLIAGGVISFVTWNWADIDKPVKVLLITAALVAAHGSGYWLWRVSGRLPRLGHALILLGSLIFGADVGLLSQIFHISTDPSAGFGVWAIGAAVAAWALPSVPNGVLAVGVASIWASVFLEEHHTLHFLVPYLVAVPFFALAVRTSSRVMFLATALGTLWCMAYAAGSETGDPIGPLVALVLAAALLLAFAFRGAGARFTAVARPLGLVAVVSIAYVVSFHEVAEDLALAEIADRPATWLGFAVPVAVAAVALFFVALRRERGALSAQPTTLIAYGGCFLLLLAWMMPEVEVVGAVAGNLVLAAICISAITSSVSTLERGPFWGGTLLGGLVIVSRFFEYETELWLRGLVFLACGIAMIAFGRVFERRRTARGPKDA